MERKRFLKFSSPVRVPGCGFLHLLFLSFLFVFLVPSPVIAKAKKEGVYHVVGKGETLYRISLAYKVPIAKILEANRLFSPSAIQVGRKLLIPGSKTIRRVEPSVPLSPQEKTVLETSLENEEKSVVDEGSAEPGGEQPPWFGKELDMIWPIQGRINSPFGPRNKRLHAGIDIASPSYQEVRAAMDGEVILARTSRKGYGNVVVLRHDSGYTTIYGHMNVIIGKEGESVRQGQAVGGVGSTGKSTGPHLHFEIRQDGRPLDPLPLLPPTLEELLERAAKQQPQRKVPKVN